ncbi:MAG: serine hydrolase [Saprospiraceae bacterium]|nr:serine hydrolase [Saprospiraceae bacterium]
MHIFFRLLFLFPLALLLHACRPAHKIAGRVPANPLEKILAAQAGSFDSILSRPDVYQVQIIYTQIDRDKQQRPHFTRYTWNLDDTRYFYPASVVKMPLAVLALEKINWLRASGYPKLSRDTPYLLDSLRPFQANYKREPTAPGGKPTIAHDIRQVFVVSDNEAYNHLFEFLGREEINRTLHDHGYVHTGIVHRFNYPGRDNRYSQPISFYDDRGGIFQEGERFTDRPWKNPQQSLRQGSGYIDGRDSLVLQAFDFSRKNWFALGDMEKMLCAILFPEAVPAENTFNLRPDDYRFLWQCMGLFPRECPAPAYDTAHYWDSYVKFFVEGDSKRPLDGSVRAFNKVGEAYGYLTDVAYVVDFEHNVEFILAATICCNTDGIFNDGRYDYDQTGFPFLANLGRAVLEYERKRPRKVSPDLRPFAEALRVN